MAAGGIDAVTFRDVAAAAGYSTAIVSHYFADKRELLIATYRTAGHRAADRIAKVVAADPADLLGVLEALSPQDDDRRADWRVWAAFWGGALGDADLAAEQRASVRDARARVAAVLEVGGVRPGPASREAARSLLAVLQGMATQAIFDPEDWPPDRQHQLLVRAVAAVAPARG